MESDNRMEMSAKRILIPKGVEGVSLLTVSENELTSKGRVSCPEDDERDQDSKQISLSQMLKNENDVYRECGAGAKNLIPEQLYAMVSGGNIPTTEPLRRKQN
ncbi:hypothetical protein NPIL_42951 [Nephila pilipes]|uniref:Uncharacterized protein n=1 Tax=Nephila pilipes TaxID=299642 RepID=A0A8X6NS98_NEPPI|nr:hypothetical protein NPIL_42951 [Nephila pilipes]